MKRLDVKALFARIVSWMTRPYVPSDYNIKKMDVDATKANNGLSANTYPGVNVYDKNSQLVSKYDATIATDGTVYTRLYARNYDTSGNIVGNSAAQVDISVNKSGTATTTLRGTNVYVGNANTTNVYVKSQTLADFVVAQGTSGIFRYRKWNSGASECWGIWSGSLTHYATVGTALFYGYHTGSVAWPSGLFNATPTVTYTAQVAQGFSTTGAELGVSSSSIILYALGTVSGTQTVTFHIHAMGKWK